MAVENSGDIQTLPEGCLANALSLTSPKDACRLSAVASSFRDASGSDTVWERFLPSDYRDIISRGVDGESWERFQSKKELYLYLCDNPILIDGGRMSFSLDRTSGKKCFTLSARDLFIVWSGTPQYWRWISSSNSRFSEIAELVAVCWLEIRGKINLNMLSPSTNYAAYLIFTTNSAAHGFGLNPAEGCVTITGHEDSEKRAICLNPDEQRQQRRRWSRRLPRFTPGEVAEADEGNENINAGNLRKRDDGWMEVELGEHFVGNGDVGDLEMSLTEVKGGNWKSGLLIQGIEVRPKHKE